MWTVTYTFVFGCAVWIGHAVTAATRADQIPPTMAAGCTFGFALTLLSTLIAFRYAYSKRASFRLPSLRRAFPFIWWEDPLQGFFGFTLVTFGLVFGSGFTVLLSGRNGIWTFTLFSCLFGGYAVGQVIGYAIYRREIQRA